MADRKKPKEAERPREPTPEELQEILKNLALLRNMEQAEVLPLEEKDGKEDDDGDL